MLFISRQNEADVEFDMYLSAARHLLKLKDVEFAYGYVEDLSELHDIEQITKSETFTRHHFYLRVIRRNNLSDVKDFNHKDKPSVLDIERFISRSTFIGDGPDLV